MMISGAETRLCTPKLFTGRQMGAETCLYAPKLFTIRQMGAETCLCAPKLRRVILFDAIIAIESRLCTRRVFLLREPEAQKKNPAAAPSNSFSQILLKSPTDFSSCFYFIKQS